MALTPDPSRTKWVKSSYSNGEGAECVEWAPEYARATGDFLVRDSKNPDGPVLGFPVGPFASFVAGVKAGEFGTV
ncbi:DUF397 domain-containing protein [Streptomyces sp. NPDC093085]|uniref:DUF397 domain-containing protein n=1 Tax=Streptomyces sp. NPDC093085 TaxID=3155068 RepID=UPI0034361E16